MARFYTSDTHFGHKNILKFTDRPFATIEEHDEGLIHRWNTNVGPEDEVWHLGDFAFCSRTKGEAILSRLNGKKYLIRGNHDHRKQLPRVGFENVTRETDGRVRTENLKEIWTEDKSRRVVLCHFAIESWHNGHMGSMHLHGHSHNTLYSARANRWDVGVDSWMCFPVREANLLENIETDPHNIGSVDCHHPR